MTATDDRGPGTAIRDARANAGLTVRDLAARVNVSAATISGIENGKTGVSVARLQELADALGVTAAQLLTSVDNESSTRVNQTPPPAIRSDSQANWREFPPLPLDPVLRVAIDSFVEMGYHATSMRVLATRIGVSVPTIYHRYPDKQQILVRIFDIAMGELHWRVSAARTQATNSREHVSLIVEALALFHTHRQKLAFIGASEMRGLEGSARRRITRSRDLLQHSLDQAIGHAMSDGYLPPRDPRTAARAISTMCTSLPQWFDPNGAVTPAEVAQEYVGFALAMLGAEQPPGDVEGSGTVH